MASLEVKLDSRGASLRNVSRNLAGMDGPKVARLFRQHLERAAQPYPRAVRASVLAIPVKGKKHTGLRARIALCATLSSGEEARGAWVSVWMNPGNMTPDYKTLPLYMEGVAPKFIRWRHPVYGHSERKWAQQDAHPYFYQAVGSLGSAAQAELDAALDDVTRDLEA